MLDSKEELRLLQQRAGGRWARGFYETQPLMQNPIKQSDLLSVGLLVTNLLRLQEMTKSKYETVHRLHGSAV